MDRGQTISLLASAYLASASQQSKGRWFAIGFYSTALSVEFLSIFLTIDFEMRSTSLISMTYSPQLVKFLIPSNH